jgi:hypothetical protein
MRALIVAVSVCAVLGCTPGAADDELGEHGEHGTEGEGDGDEEPYVYLDELEPAESLASPRFAHAAVVLADGRALMVGGVRGAPSQLGVDAFVAEVELFDPSTEQFEQGAALSSPRSWPSATRIADGRVMVIGGTTLDSNSLSIPARDVELWDPAGESFAVIDQLPSGGVLFHCATPLAGGVLVIDDCYPEGCTPLQIDPAAGVTVLGGTPSYRYGLDVDCATLPDGRVFLGGSVELVDGYDVAVPYAEIYDPVSQSFELVGPMSSAHGAKSRLATLANGELLIFGDAVVDGALGQIYSPATGELRAVSAGVGNRVDHSMTVLADGRVLIAGGHRADAPELIPELDLFDPSTGEFTTLSPAFAPRWGHTATALGTGPVVIVGGRDGAGQRDDVYLFR